MAAEGLDPWRKRSGPGAHQRRRASWAWAPEVGGRPVGGSGHLQSEETHLVSEGPLLEARAAAPLPARAGQGQAGVQPLSTQPPSPATRPTAPMPSTPDAAFLLGRWPTPGRPALPICPPYGSLCKLPEAQVSHQEPSASGGAGRGEKDEGARKPPRTGPQLGRLGVPLTEVRRKGGSRLGEAGGWVCY